MKPLSHHVRKLAEYFEKAEKLLDPKKAHKLIEKAEKRKHKIAERLRRGTKPQPAEPVSEDGQ
jgi:hypothetical protein